MRDSRVAFLHHMAITFMAIAAFMLLVTRLAPAEPRDLKTTPAAVDLAPAAHARLAAGAVVAATAVLYVVFW